MCFFLKNSPESQIHQTPESNGAENIRIFPLWRRVARVEIIILCCFVGAPIGGGRKRIEEEEEEEEE